MNLDHANPDSAALKGRGVVCTDTVAAGAAVEGSVSLGGGLEG